MATLTKLHDVSTMICGDDPPNTRLANAYYNAETNVVYATTASMIVFVPVAGKPSTSAFLPKDTLKSLGKLKGSVEIIAEKGEPMLNVDGNNQPIPQVVAGNPLDCYSIAKRAGQPKRVFGLALKNLKKLVAYANKHMTDDNEAIYFGLHDDDAEPLHFFFKTPTDEDQSATLIAGLIAGFQMHEDALKPLADEAFALVSGQTKKQKGSKSKTKTPPEKAEAEGNAEPAQKTASSKPARTPAVKTPAVKTTPVKPSNGKPGAVDLSGLPDPDATWPEKTVNYFKVAREKLEATRPALARRFLNFARESAEAATPTARKAIDAALVAWNSKVDEVHAFKKEEAHADA